MPWYQEAAYIVGYAMLIVGPPYALLAWSMLRSEQRQGRHGR